MFQVLTNEVPQRLIEDIYRFCEEGSFTPRQKAFDQSDIKRMSMYLDEDNHLIKSLLDIIKANIYDPETYYLYEVYINANTMADAPLSHTDSDDAEDITAIYYANINWDMDFGGETVFFDTFTGDIMNAVIPVPGRIVIFSSNIRHAARIQNRIAPTFRYTIAFKLHKNRHI